MQNKIITVILLSIFCITSAFERSAQPDTCFTYDEIEALYVGIQELETEIEYLKKKGNLQSELIVELEEQIYQYEVLVEQDSLLIESYEEQVNLLHERLELYIQLVEEVEPAWHENKFLWFGYGAALILISSWVVGNVM